MRVEQVKLTWWFGLKYAFEARLEKEGNKTKRWVAALFSYPNGEEQVCMFNNGADGDDGHDVLVWNPESVLRWYRGVTKENSGESGIELAKNLFMTLVSAHK